MDGFFTIRDDDRIRIVTMIDEKTSKRKAPLALPKLATKRTVPLQETGKNRINRLKSSTLPTIGILYTNADQLTPSKMTELKKVIERKKPLIVAVCEVKPKTICERTAKDFEIPNFTTHPTNLDNDTGRGIAIYTHKSLDKSTIQVIPSSGFEEACLVEVRLRGGGVLLFACCYRSPSITDHSEANNESLDRLLKCISQKKYSHVCVVGDFNYKLINWSSWTTTRGEESGESQFIESVRDCFFHQHVENPTRRRGNDEPSTLDLVFTNESLQVSDIVHNSPLGKSDHDVLTFEFQCYVDFNKPKERFLFKKGNYPAMRDNLTKSRWREVYIEQANEPNATPESMWNSLKGKLHELRNEFVPLKSVSSKPTWKDLGSIPLDGKTVNAIKEKDKAHRLWMSGKKKGEADISRAKYTKARNNVKTLLRKAKRRFEREIAMQAKTNPKAFWGHARRSLKTKPGVAPLLSNPKDKGSMKFNDGEKASILLQQFSSVFTQESDGDIPTLESRTDRRLNELLVTPQMVAKELKDLNLNKSCGPSDELHPRLLYELADLIAEPVAILFNATLKGGDLPMDWKKATITPIYKKGSRHHAENYRPISLTSILCKTMEKFVRDAVVKHLCEANLLSPKQFGFISGRCTTTQLLSYLDECIKIITNGGVVDAIYLDFAKAFDTVPHRRLLGKLNSYGIEGQVFNWVKGFLCNRTQEVMVNGSKSKSDPVISGVPQGTVLGPVLFVIYINDLLDDITSHGLMFADDTKIFRLITSREDAIKLQEDISKLEEWTRVWQVHFNHTKCHVLTLGKFENIRYAHNYTIMGNELEHVADEKDLGITIDGDLNFEEHISRKIRVANGIVGQIRRSFSYLDGETFRRLYCAFVRPHLEYGQAIWSPHLKRNINRLENVQVRATKLVDGLAKLDYPERLKRLNLPTLAHRRERGDMMEMYKHFYTYDKCTLPSTFNPRSRETRTHNFQLLTTRPRDGDRGIQTNFFYHRSAGVWNNLPENVVKSKTINAFKNSLDEYWKNNPSIYDHTTHETIDDEE